MSQINFEKTETKNIILEQEEEKVSSIPKEMITINRECVLFFVLFFKGSFLGKYLYFIYQNHDDGWGFHFFPN